MRTLVLIVMGLLGSNVLAADNQPAATCEVIVDFSKSAGKIRPLNGVNNGPFVDGNHTADMNARHKEAAFPSVRLHDCHWPNPNVVDIPSIFPLFHADADDPKNYVFGPTDKYLAPIAERGAEIVYRLGVSIEHRTRYHTRPPADYEKWAKICVNVIKHYNDGWAGGKHYGIKYFEIWNEPDIGPRMWTGTPQQYFDLYRTAVTAIKAYNPALKIGGQVSFVKGKYTKPFLAYCRDQKLPLDFFSWHRYSDTPTDLMDDARLVRSLLDEYGFKKAESLCTEWRPMIEGFDKVSWEQGRPAGSVRAAFARNRNHESAAFTASALMQMQDEFGEPGKVFFAFKAFNMFLQTTNRVVVTGAPGGDGVTACGGLSDDGKTAGLLLSHYKGKTVDVQIALKDFPLVGDIKVERFSVDAEHDARRDVMEGRDRLQQHFNQPVLGFAYPGGAYSDTVKTVVREAGHTYARTVVQVLRCFPPEDPMAFHPNCHHEVTDFWDRYEKARESGVFYFWGHSYEFVDDRMWSLFEDKIKRISNDSGAEWGIVADLFAWAGLSRECKGTT